MTTTTTKLNDVDLEAVGGLVDVVRNDPAAGATRWHATTTWRGGFRSEAGSRHFAPTASDEPGKLGGTDTASNPVEQLLGALGNCLAVGYAASATAAGIELSDLTIDVSGDLDLHAFLGLRPGHAGFSGIEAVVRVSPVDPDADLGPIHDHVVATSPVGHTLAHPVPVSIDFRANPDRGARA